MADTAQPGLAGIANFALAILILVLFVWTPKTGCAILIFAVLIILAIAGVAVFSNREKIGYSPEEPKDS